MKLSLTFNLRDVVDARQAVMPALRLLDELAAVVDLPSENVSNRKGPFSWEVRDTLGNLIGQASISDSKGSGPCLEWPGS